MLDNSEEDWVQIPFCFFSAIELWTSHSISLNASFLTATLGLMIPISHVGCVIQCSAHTESFTLCLLHGGSHGNAGFLPDLLHSLYS